MRVWSIFKLIQITVIFLCCISCKKDDQIVNSADYPRDIGKIIVGKCATSGCHNDRSYKNAAGLNLSTWDNLFKGGNSGAVLIPFNSKFSSMCYFINTYPELGLTNLPVMPLNESALSREDVKKITKWIDEGAKDANGNLKFPPLASRRKFYVAHTACKVVAVFDAESMLQMSYVNVVGETESFTAHQVKTSPDGKYWYVCYTNNGSYLRRYSTYDDHFAGEIAIGNGDWNTLSFSPDSKKAYVIDWSSSGKVAECDLVNMKIRDSIRYSFYPHGSAISPDGNFLYFTATTGNFIFKKNLNDGNIDFIPLNSNETPGLPSSIYNPHEILFSPDGSKYYVSCQNEKTIRVFNTSNDECIAVIPINGSALEMCISKSKNFLFVSSWDSNQFTGTIGAVAIINTVDNSLLRYINVGTEPHGIAVDEEGQRLYIANRNINISGPLPHHTSVCGGRNGYLSVLDLNTFVLIKKRIELSVDPYSVSMKY